jgi:hypothetical protein
MGTGGEGSARCLLDEARKKEMEREGGGHMARRRREESG